MTPEFKALDLFNKFYLVNAESVELETGELDLIFSLSEHDAKQCALLCVEELLLCSMALSKDSNWASQVRYWQDVKKEIEKL